MRSSSEFRRLFAYDDWANREALASLRAAPAPPPRAQRFLAHIIGAELLWLARLRGEPSPTAVWPELSLDECARWLGELPDRWRAYLDAVPVNGLASTIGYTNTKGERWTNRVEDVLLHVIMHSVYHRGQIATEVRAAGHTPAYTDYIQAVRTNSIAPDE